MGYCEDGVWTPIPPPTQLSVLVFDPNIGHPIWELPANLGGGGTMQSVMRKRSPGKRKKR